MSAIGESVDLYIASLRARHVPANTIKAYTHDLRHFVATVPADLDQVTAPVIQQFLEGDGPRVVQRDKLKQSEKKQPES